MLSESRWKWILIMFVLKATVIGHVSLHNFLLCFKIQIGSVCESTRGSLKWSYKKLCYSCLAFKNNRIHRTINSKSLRDHLTLWCVKFVWRQHNWNEILWFCPTDLMTNLQTVVLGFAFSLNTPPGTKIKLLGLVEVKNGFLLLDDRNTVVLGGEVEHLIEKWELQRVR